MSGIRQKTSGICQHSKEISKKSQVCQRCHLFDHSSLVVVEPPCRSLLNLSCHTRILKTSKNRSDGFIVIWIQTVDNRLWKAVFLVQCIEKICHLCGRRIVIDTVISGIRSKLRITGCIVVSLTSIMKLHCPVSLCILLCCKCHKCCFKFQFFFFCQHFTLFAFCKDLFQIFFCFRHIHHIFQRMIAGTTSHFFKCIHSLL